MFKFLSKKLLVITLLALTTSVFAQDQILTVGANHEMKNETVLTFQNDNQTIIRFDLNEVELIEIETGDGKAFIAMSDNAPLMLQEGCPEMFYLTTTFIIPDTGGSELEISYGQFQEFDNIEIAPSKGNLTRNIDPATVPFVKGAVYQYDGFFPGTLASLREPFIMRDVRGQSLDVYPVQYNPVTKVLRVYSEITVTVRYTETEGINEFTDQKRHTTIDPQFNEMYKDLFINNSVMQSRGFPTEEEGELLIICHTAFVDNMKPYVDWKRTTGRKTTIVPTSSISPLTKENIKTYILNYYNAPGNNLAYVLLVGDHPQLPPHQVGTIRSDVEYGKLTGNDNYLEVLIGRMSASEVAHVNTQVQRSIWYERDTETTDTWLSKAVGLASKEGAGGGHDGGEADYVHMNNIRTRLMTYGYTPVWQEYTWDCPGVPNTSVAQISSRFNEGAGIANYCNHGAPTAWTLSTSYYNTLDYTTAHVNQLQNAGKLPFIFSVACNNGEFGPWQHNTSDAVCFAEAWLRATQGGQPTGAVATYMATVEMNWIQPMTAQDAFVNICLDLPSQYGGTSPGIKRTFAGATLNASQKMIMIHGSGGLSDFNSWIVFGDPTLMIRTKTPQTMTVTHSNTISAGATSFTVNCNVNDALVSISYINTSNDVVILGTKVVAGGVANVTLNPAVSTGPITVCVTARDRVTYLGTVTVGGSSHIPVTDITGVTTTATATLPLTLTGTVVPSDATNQTITWSVQNAGTTGATITGGNILNTTNSGTATILATIVNGASPTTNYTKTFTITVTKATLGGTVTVSGSTVFGQTLTAVTSALTSSPVIPALGTLSYQWQRGTTNISGATSSTYTLVQADIGNTVRVVVSAANCTGSVTSASSATVTKAPQTAPPAPTMASNTSTSITLNTVSGCEYNINSGAYQDSPTFDNLTASTSYPFTQRLKETATHLASPSSPVANLSTTAPEFTPVTDITGVPTTATAYIPLTLSGTVIPSDATNNTITWSMSDPGSTGANITGGNVLNTTDAGTATILATIVNGANPSGDFTKTFTITVNLAVLGGTVSINGNPVFGETLTAITTNLTSTPELSDLGTLSYQWKRSATDIGGATASTYTLAAEDVGATITVAVTAAHCSGSVTSPATETVGKASQVAPPAPTLAEKSATSITLNVVAGCEYNSDGGAWQSSPLFAGLTPETAYSFTQRYAETATHFASPASPSATFTTDASINTLYTITSTVNNPDFGTITPYGDATVEEGDDITFDIFPNDGYKIEEVLVDGVNDPAAVENGFYTFENVMEDHEIHVMFVEDGVGIAPPSPSEGEDVRVYPNPTSGELRVESGELRVESVEIFDVFGRTCNVSRVTCNENEMDISFLPTGIYFIRIKTEDGVVVRKVVKSEP